MGSPVLPLSRRVLYVPTEVENGTERSSERSSKMCDSNDFQSKALRSLKGGTIRDRMTTSHLDDGTCIMMQSLEATARRRTARFYMNYTNHNIHNRMIATALLLILVVVVVGGQTCHAAFVRTTTARVVPSTRPGPRTLLEQPQGPPQMVQQQPKSTTTTSLQSMKDGIDLESVKEQLLEYLEKRKEVGADEIAKQ